MNLDREALTLLRMKGRQMPKPATCKKNIMNIFISLMHSSFSSHEFIIPLIGILVIFGCLPGTRASFCMEWILVTSQ